MAHRNQIERLTHQHKESNGVIGIFGEDAKLHDWAVGKLAHQVMQHLAIEFPQLSFRHRIGIKKEEINKALNKIDPELGQTLFPYVLFLEGSNFLTETISVQRPDGRVVTLAYHSGMLNRLDRLTSANYGMPINMNLCKNKFVQHKDKTIMLQATSIYTQGNGERWNPQKMLEIMIDN